MVATDEMARPELHVEGRDDFHVLRELLARHGLATGATSPDPRSPRFGVADGVERLLDAIAVAVRAAGARPVGFVLDADVSLSSRWQAVCDRLREVGMTPPEDSPAEGYIGVAEDYKATVGVWLMPDNQREGKLEDFLCNLIAEGDALIGHAGEATAKATEIDMRFADGDEPKAILHTWLAWQNRPGCPYGTAMQAKYFDHNAEVAQRFVDWFKRLYGIE